MEKIYENNNSSKTNNTKFKDNYYSMLEGNTCRAEPKLEVLPLPYFSTRLV